jgi:hypothetical protein
MGNTYIPPHRNYIFIKYLMQLVKYISRYIVDYKFRYTHIYLAVYKSESALKITRQQA